MSHEQSSFVSSADGSDIATYSWTDVAGEPVGAVQLAHGLVEHGARYDCFATALNQADFLVFATDHCRHGRTGGDRLWLSRDEADVDAWFADPWCGFDLPDDMVPSLFAPTVHLADPAVLAGIRNELPILIASGSDDLLAGGGQLVEMLGKRYRDAGLTDVPVIVYPGARQEILDETNRDEVTSDLIDWLSRHVAG